jgi:hypothetical protein
VFQVASNASLYAMEAQDAMGSAEWDEYDYPPPVEVQSLGPWPLLWKYGGLAASNEVYRIRTGARRPLVDGMQSAAIEMDVQVAEIPVFAFAALYGFDLSFIMPPGQSTTINGRVHSNRDIYVFPSGSLTFGGDVTAGSTNRVDQHPSDVESRAFGSVDYQGENDGRVNSVNLLPVSGEPRLQVMDDYYRKSHLVIRVRDTNVVTLRPPDIPVLVEWTNFLSTNRPIVDPADPVVPIEFFDQRQLKTMRVIEFDVGRFAEPANYSAVTAAVGVNPTVIFLVDERTQSSTEMINAVRVVNGRHLPDEGLTMATYHPLYVHGDYNAPVLGSSDTTLTRPASLVADAVTILSGAWDDAQHGSGTNNVETLALNTTVNAAIMTGIVPSEGGDFDGGFFNALRLLEDWTNLTLTFNGSIVALYRSYHAVEPWRGDLSVYRVPNRQWSYDVKHLTPRYLPYTPVVSALIRAEWSRVAPEVVFAD